MSVIDRIVELSQAQNPRAYRRYLAGLSPALLADRLAILEAEAGRSSGERRYRDLVPKVEFGGARHPALPVQTVGR